MKKRLRKKLRLGEFTEWGFEVNFKVDIPTDQLENALDDFLDFCDGNQLMVGGGFGNGQCGFYVTTYKHPCTIFTQQIVETWLMNYKKYGKINDITVTALEDCHHMGKYKPGWPRPKRLIMKGRSIGNETLMHYPNFKLPE